MKLLGSIILLLVVCYTAAKTYEPVCCKTLSISDWESSDVKYDIAKGTLSKRDLYHSERYRIIGDTGSIDYKINDALRKYYVTVSWRLNDKEEKLGFSLVKAPKVIGGKFVTTVFKTPIHDIRYTLADYGMELIIAVVKSFMKRFVRPMFT